MSDSRLNFDEWSDGCPICKEIVEIESWPKTLECAKSPKDPDYINKTKPAPCPLCGSEELIQNWITVPNKDNRGMSHNWIMSCPSCGVGQHYEGVDAVTGKIQIVGKFPPEYDRASADKALEVAKFDGDEDAIERAKELAMMCLQLRAIFRPINFVCLDDGWDASGYGVRPLERTEIMNRFYLWTNKEAVGEATQSDNPLLKKNRDAEARASKYGAKKGKKKKWWGR